MAAAQLRDLTLDQLRDYDGGGPSGKIYLAVQGVVFDVSAGGADYYGEGAGYHVMAGREVARALACMSLKQEDCTSDLAGLTESQLKTLKQWEDRFNKQYPVVGRIVEGGGSWDYILLATLPPTPGIDEAMASVNGFVMM
ncbi:hypothetical protein WJX74_009259 [Apatococcus lobatus]|uniref:Cytochrome b5 heme-binding domain-containing protein n=1 Tax=Apatococcus lobatus TaxID=904363 RepID=A0AAW1QJK5_9CHLO